MGPPGLTLGTRAWESAGFVLQQRRDPAALLLEQPLGTKNRAAASHPGSAPPLAPRAMQRAAGRAGGAGAGWDGLAFPAEVRSSPSISWPVAAIPQMGPARRGLAFLSPCLLPALDPRAGSLLPVTAILKTPWE